MMKAKIWMACGLMLLSMLACYSNPFVPVSPSATPQPVVSIDELQFKDEETGQRFRALDRCIKDMVDNSWQTIPYRLLGNFYTASWCSGAGARSDCQIASATQDHRDQHDIELYTLFYSQDYPEVFGIGLQALWVPKSIGWGASYYFAENGGSVVGESWGVTFSQYVKPTDPPQATVHIGSGYTYTIFGPHRTDFDYLSDIPLREDLALYLSGPESMRDRALAQNQALAQKVSAAIKAHQVNTCDQEPYLGKGIPPACPTRLLTADEEAKELARADAYFAEQQQLLRDSYQEMYAAWMTAFPLDKCWP